MRVVAIDLGSNSLQIIKYDCNEDRVIKSFLATVRTAWGLVESKKISKEAVNRVIDALNRAKEELDFSDSKVVAVTTQALRVAKNAKEVIEQIKEATNIEFRVISPKEEAKLTLLAVKARLEKLNINRDFVVVDIGGGSTELSYYIDGKIYSKSFDLGIVTIANMAKSLEEIKREVKLRVKEIEEFAKRFDNKELIFCATAGTPTTIAALKHGLNYENYDANIVTGTKLTIKDLDFYLDKLLKLSKKEREVAVGVGRDDLIVAGIIIFKEIYRVLDKKEAIIIDDGLSMGLAISSCKE